MALVCDFSREQFVSKGMIADIARHANPGNPHAHILLTMRLVVDGQFSAKKERSWNDVALLQEWREAWAKAQNQAFERQQINAKVDHRSLLEQGVDRIPQKHIGALLWNMAKRGLAWAKEVVHEKTGRSGVDTAELQQEERGRAGIDRVQSPGRALDYASFRNLFIRVAGPQGGQTMGPVKFGALYAPTVSPMGDRSSRDQGVGDCPSELPHPKTAKRARGR
jgi:ATP-dependent exoDNAse (exonuclease V) alpha subunit